VVATPQVKCQRHRLTRQRHELELLCHS
jgi:hypothetical protein